MHRTRVLAPVCSVAVLATGITLATATPAQAVLRCSQALTAARSAESLSTGVLSNNFLSNDTRPVAPCGGAGGTADPPPPAPRYALEAVWFKCIDETGGTQVGSDETRFSFDATDAQGNRIRTAQSFGDVDSGESRDFRSSTRPLSPAGGSLAPFTLSTNVMENDTWPDYDDTIGNRDSTWSAAQLQQSLPDVGMSIVETQTFNGDSSNYVLYLTISRVS